MPSKRTNDSVDRILQDLNQQQTAAGVRDTVTDHQVDEILRSVGISTTPLHGTPEQDHRIAFSGLDDLDGFDMLSNSAPAPQPQTQRPATQRPAAQAPVQQAPREAVRQPAAQPTQKPVQKPVQSAPSDARPVRPVEPSVSASQERSKTDTGTLGDTTRTGIIKGFLLKMAPMPMWQTPTR